MSIDIQENLNWALGQSLSLEEYQKMQALAIAKLAFIGNKNFNIDQ